MSTYHTIPLHDLIEHTDSTDCPCHPDTKTIQADDGTIHWHVIHNALDGREGITGHDLGTIGLNPPPNTTTREPANNRNQ